MTENDKNHVEVAVVTTSGRYPASGFVKVASHEPVETELKRAVNGLHITDTNGWIARVDGRQIDPAKSYAQNNLTGTVVVDYGPREGGGGDE